MFVKRATLALGVVFVAAGWTNLANAATCADIAGSLPANSVGCYDATDGGGLVVPNTSVTHNVGPGVSGTDEIEIVINGPNGVNSPGAGATSALHFTSKAGVLITGLSAFSYDFTSTAGSGAPNTSGALSTDGTSTSFDLDLTATSPAGGAFSYYKLLLHWTTSGTTGGGYQYSLAIDPCDHCFGGGVPLPPAAILFASGLAGLGLLGRKRRKNAQQIEQA